MRRAHITAGQRRENRALLMIGQVKSGPSCRFRRQGRGRPRIPSDPPRSPFLTQSRGSDTTHARDGEGGPASRRPALHRISARQRYERLHRTRERRQTVLRSSRRCPYLPGGAGRVMDEMLTWVRWLWERGMWLFPLDHPALPACAGLHRPDKPCDGKRGKHPCVPWSRRATNRPALLRAMFSHEPRNVGLACKVSGVLVVDEDKPGAFTSYAESIGQTVEPTLTVTTAKGRHFYYRPPEGVELGNGVGALAGHGLDVRGGRGHGGYVVAPGSLHETGVIYTPVALDAPILPAPGWLVEALQARPERPAAPRSGPVVKGGGKPYRVLVGLVQTVLDATPGVDRNSRLFWAACRMHEHAALGLFDVQAGQSVLLEAARRVGLADGEAEATIASAGRNVGGYR